MTLSWPLPRSSASSRRGSRSHALRALSWVTALHGALVLAAWYGIGSFDEGSVAGTLLLYGPRWLLAAPLALLAAAAVWLRCWPLLAVHGLCAALVFGPVLGPSLSLARFRHAGGARGLRVMTHNLGRVPPNAAAVVESLREEAPDLVLLQECVVRRGRGLPVPAGWFAEHGDQLCVLSRYPIQRVDARDRSDVWARGGAGLIVLYEIALPNATIHVLHLHLETVRAGLESLRHGDLQGLKANFEDRLWETTQARAWARRARGPLLVVGDLNMPVESRIYEQHWSEFGNAFSLAGLGYGATKRTRWFGARIDHVLFTREWECLGAWLGAETGSDHRPLVADLRLLP